MFHALYEQIPSGRQNYSRALKQTSTKIKTATCRTCICLFVGNTCQHL